MYWPNKLGDAFNVCEFRVVFGISQEGSQITYSDNSYEKGDEISENLYRFFKNETIRFVYVESTESNYAELTELAKQCNESFSRYVETLKAVTQLLKPLNVIGQ